MSSPAERKELVADAAGKSRMRLRGDIRKAKSDAEKVQLFTNFYKLDELFLKSIQEVLDANGAAVEDAYEKAKQAQKDVDEAYRKAKELVEKIRLVSKVVTTAGSLIKKASGQA